MSSIVDPKLLQVIQESTCFGIAYDGGVPECIKCDVKGPCKTASEGAPIPAPVSNNFKPETKNEVKSETAKVEKPVEKPVKKSTNKQPESGATSESTCAIDFKAMTLDDMKAMAEKEEVAWKEYGNDNITRMRLTMALKKHFGNSK